MQKNIINSIIDIYFKDCQDKIIRNESLEEYYSSFPKKDLQSILGTYLLIKDDVTYLSEVPYESENTKEEIVDYILDNYKEIYQDLLCVLDDNSFDQWKRLIKGILQS